MGFFRRARAEEEPPAPSPLPVPDEGDGPQALRRSMEDVIAFINRRIERNSDRLPDASTATGPAPSRLSGIQAIQIGLPAAAASGAMAAMRSGVVTGLW